MELTIFWLILFILLVVIEIATMGLTTIWFAGGALAASLASGIGLPIWLQVGLFLVVSLVLLIFTRPVAVKYFNKDRTKTNIESMIGTQGVVTGEIDNLQGIGQITVGSMEWTARSVNPNDKIAVGTVVIVRRVEGVKLIVEEKRS